MTLSPEQATAIHEAETALLNAVLAAMAETDVEQKYRRLGEVWFLQHRAYDVTRNAALETRKAALDHLECAA